MTGSTVVLASCRVGSTLVDVVRFSGGGGVICVPHDATSTSGSVATSNTIFTFRSITDASRFDHYIDIKTEGKPFLLGFAMAAGGETVARSDCFRAVVAGGGGSGFGGFLIGEVRLTGETDCAGNVGLLFLR